MLTVTAMGINMWHHLTTNIILLVLCCCLLTGCNKDAPEQSTPVQEETHAEVDYEAEAKKEINEANMEDELERLEQEIGQDSNQAL